MGDYNADADPNILHASLLMSYYSFAPGETLFTDQWTIDPHTRVNNFADGTGRICFKIKYDPTLLPLK